MHSLITDIGKGVRVSTPAATLVAGGIAGASATTFDDTSGWSGAITGSAACTATEDWRGRKPIPPGDRDPRGAVRVVQTCVE